ncbi:PIN domain-containing protein [Paenibacillus sp. T2-29]
MKYLLLDTNIFLDMVFSRTKSSPPETLLRLDNLLKWETISLIVPEIVIVETQRHIHNLINEIPNNVNNILKMLEESYWINIEAELPKYKAVVKETSKSLKEYKLRMETNKENYMKGLSVRVNRLFSKATIIKTDNDLVFNVAKRKLFKKCPLHTNKQSDQDALIIETLLNIKNYIDIGPKDEIYFISRNYKDFSKSKAESDIFHDDIQHDLSEAGLIGTIKYRNLLFKTLKDDFDVEHITASEIQEEYDAFLVAQGENYSYSNYDYYADLADALDDEYNPND